MTLTASARLLILLGLVALLSGSSCGGRSCNVVQPNGCDSVALGGTVSGLTGTLVLALNGTAQTITSNGPFTFDRKLPPDNTYTVTILSQPVGETCTVTNATGAVGLGVTDITVLCQATPAALVVVQGAGHVSVFSVDPASGALTAVTGGAAGAEARGASVAVHPGRQFAYRVNPDADAVEVYPLAAGGNLAALPSGSFATGADPRAVAVEPGGHFVYVANYGSGDVSAYVIEPASGALTAIPGSPFAAGSGPTALALEASGRYLYVANALSYNVSGYALDPISGALTALAGGPYPAGTRPAAIATDRDGRFVFVANESSADVSAYALETASGALTPVVGSPFRMSGRGDTALRITVSR